MLWVLIKSASGEKNVCCGYWLEAPHRGTSNEYPQHMFLWRTGENYPIIITKYSLTIPFVLIFFLFLHENISYAVDTQ